MMGQTNDKAWRIGTEKQADDPAMRNQPAMDILCDMAKEQVRKPERKELLGVLAARAARMDIVKPEMPRPAVRFKVRLNVAPAVVVPEIVEPAGKTYPSAREMIESRYEIRGNTTRLPSTAFSIHRCGVAIMTGSRSTLAMEVSQRVSQDMIDLTKAAQFLILFGFKITHPEMPQSIKTL